MPQLLLDLLLVMRRESLAKQLKKWVLQQQRLRLQRVVLRARPQQLGATLLVRLRLLQEVMLPTLVLRLLTRPSLLAVLQAMPQLLLDLLPVMPKERMARQLQKQALQR
jgi:hypothetical protein